MNSTNDPLIGQQLGNYLVQHPLGRGGMARVYKGLDVSLKRPVAIKVIAEDLRGSSSYAQRFEREAQAVANLKHPNIVTVFHFGSQNGLYYMVMEYLDGVDLDAIMRNYEDTAELMPHADVIRILQVVASALDYAHSKGVIHRDVKPSNIMLERDGRPVLTDFGLALRVSEGSIGDTFGSPHYISPEQARSSANAVPQSDIYSLGVIAYELLAGTVPFDDPNPTSLAMQHIMSEVPSPRIFNRDLSVQVESVLNRALAKDPADRYPTAEAFITDLRQALEALKQNPVKAVTADLPPLPPGMTPPPPRRMSMQTARDKLDQELALSQAKGQALTKQMTVKQAAAAGAAPTVVRRPSFLPYIIAGAVAIIALVAVGMFLLNSNNTATALPTVAVLPTLTAAPTLNSAAQTAIASDRKPTATQTNAVVEAATAAPPVDFPTDVVTAAPPTVPPTAIPPTAIPTSAPTSQASLTATTVPSAAPTQAAQPTTQPTVLYPDGRKFVIVWNDEALFMANQSGENVPVSNINFERLLTNGLPDERYEGRRWSAYYGYSEASKCELLTVTGKSRLYSKIECPYGINGDVNAQTRERFWTPKDGSVEFRVLWIKQEVARCQIATKRCEVRFPK